MEYNIEGWFDQWAKIDYWLIKIDNKGLIKWFSVESKYHTDYSCRSIKIIGWVIEIIAHLIEFKRG